jgi:murein L,D-transpeptidase YafK
MRNQVITFVLTCFSCALLPQQSSLAVGATADRVVVFKNERTLTLMHAGETLKVYKVALGSEPLGAKQRQGDHKTPEGSYVLDRRNSKSKFYRSLHVSYPDAKQKVFASQHSINPGGDIMIHGLPNGFGWLGKTHLVKDWTDGCIAVTNEEMDEIWTAVDDGTPIDINP